MEWEAEEGRQKTGVRLLAIKIQRDLSKEYLETVEKKNQQFWLYFLPHTQ